MTEPRNEDSAGPGTRRDEADLRSVLAEPACGWEDCVHGGSPHWILGSVKVQLCATHFARVIEAADTIGRKSLTGITLFADPGKRKGRE